jgi:hypothetical protein
MRSPDSLHHLDPEYSDRARRVRSVLPDAADEHAIDPLGEHRRRVGPLVDALIAASQPDAPPYVGPEEIAGKIADAIVAAERVPSPEWRRVREAAARLEALDGDDAASATLLLLDAAGRGYLGAAFNTLQSLAAKRPRLSAFETIVALRLVHRFTRSHHYGELLAVPLANAERLAKEGHQLPAAELHKTLAALEGPHAYAAQLVPLRAKIRALLPSTTSALDLTPILPVDPWGRLVRGHLEERYGTVTALGPLLRHLAAATSSKATREWRQRWRELVAQVPEGLAAARLMLDDVLVAEANPDAKQWDRLQHLFDARNHDVVRGACWAVGLAAPPWAARLLGDVALRAAGVSDKVPNACLLMLAELGTEDATGELVRLRASVKHQGLLKRVKRALDELAHRAEIPTFELMESAVPTCGLDAAGRKEIAFDGILAKLALGAFGEVDVRWSDPAGAARKAPAGTAGRPARTAVRAAEKELAKAVGLERGRLEELLTAERVWPLDRWSARYLAHPITGNLARRLVWSIETKAETFSALPDATGGSFLRSDGAVTRVATSDGRVRLWHPLGADERDVAAWRRYVVDRRLRQPFAQAFREVYRVDAATRVRTSSDRFAGHLLHYQTLFALLKERRWATNYLGPWDRGYDGEGRRDFEWVGVRAIFRFGQLDEGDVGQLPVRLCATKNVTFVRSRDAHAKPLALGEVPAIVLSEALRDVDLFVSLSSIATAKADMSWDDPALAPLLPRRERHPDDATTRTRRAVLEHVLPRLPVAERCRIDDAALLVRGDRAVYRIDIATGRVRAASAELVLAETALPPLESSALFLPVEEDAILHRVLRSALLLARDREMGDAGLSGGPDHSGGPSVT